MKSQAVAFSKITPPYTPNKLYSASKADSDQLFGACLHTHSLPTITTNFFNNYGPHQFSEKSIPLMCINTFMGKQLTIYRDGKNTHGWVTYDYFTAAAISHIIAR